MAVFSQFPRNLNRSASRVTIAALALAFFAAGNPLEAPAQAGSTLLTEPPAPLLPATLGKLKRVAPGDVGEGLQAVDATDANVLKEDGLKRFASSDYEPAATHAAPQGTVTVYKFMDASGAISAFDYFKKPGMRPEKLGDAAVSNGDQLLLRSGVNVVRANFQGGHDAIATLTRQLIIGLPKVGGAAGQPPLLPTLLPAKGLDADSIRYALGPQAYTQMGGVLPAQTVGFDKSAETVTAKYKNGGTLTLLLYPTPEIAGDRARAIQAAMQQQGSTAGTVMLRREGTLVALTSGAWTEAAAHSMVEGIHLRTELSFDKPLPPEFHTEIQKTYSLLESIVIFCALAAVAMAVLGLFFGGGRALIRVMQGKPAATEPEFLRIDLRGNVGKRLGGPEA